MLAMGHLPSPPDLGEEFQQDPRVAAEPVLDKGFALSRKVGDGVYATVANPSRGFEAVSNGGFIVGKDAALLIEGHASPAGAAFELEALRKVSSVPVRGALDTHYHFDHVLGNSFYGANRIAILAHARTGSLMFDRYAQIQAQDRSETIAPLEKRLREARTNAERERIQGDLNALKSVGDAVDANLIALPNVPLEPARMPMRIDLGGIRALIETHPGHTPGDLIVRIPEQNITFTGDLLFNGSYPVTIDASMSAWLKTLSVFQAYGKDALFVPGHGQIAGQNAIAGERAAVEDLGEQARRMFTAGVPVEEAEQRYVIPESLKNLTYFAWGFTIAPAIRKFYEEFSAR
jgi:glyoxylase-like metal-dependent hydrolase (beta-lactamase superfamily II)